MDDKLKLCPFCGNEAEVFSDITCSCSNMNCYANFPAFGINEWDNRPIEDALQAKLDIAIEALERIHLFHDGYCENHINISRHSHDLDDIAYQAIAEIRELEDNNSVVGTWQCQWCGAIHTTKNMHCPCEGKIQD